MRYTEPLSEQILIFIRAMGPGVLIGLLYDVIFSFFRSFGTKRALVITADLLFSVSATLLSFFYMVIYNSGTVRLNIITAQLMGAVAFHFALGKYIAKPVEFFAHIMSKTLGVISFPFSFLLDKTAGYLGKFREKIKEKIKPKKKTGDEKKKIKNILKIHLKK